MTLAERTHDFWRLGEATKVPGRTKTRGEENGDAEKINCEGGNCGLAMTHSRKDTDIDHQNGKGVRASNGWLFRLVIAKYMREKMLKDNCDNG